MFILYSKDKKITFILQDCIKPNPEKRTVSNGRY